MSSSRPTGAGGRHEGGKRRSVVHSHDAYRPEHVLPKSDINITPFIDVLLVLLIIFMVVTPLTQKGLDIALPQPPPPNVERPKDTKSDQYVLSIEEAAGGGGGVTYTINKEPPLMTLEDLEQKLTTIFQARIDKTLFVRGSGKVTYGRIVEAMDRARMSGVDRIGIISEKMIEDAGGTPAGASGQ